MGLLGLIVNLQHSALRVFAGESTTAQTFFYGGGQGMIAGWENPCFSTV
jgi:hypothetical protein